MNETNPKRLSLNRETIRNLSDENLDQVAGGQGGGVDDVDDPYTRRGHHPCHHHSRRYDHNNRCE
jgi:hypothetical protein